MAEDYDAESPVNRMIDMGLLIIMMGGLSLSVVAMFMDHTNIAVALAGVGGIAMVLWFMRLIMSTFLPLPDFAVDDAPRVDRQEVEDRPTIH